MNCTIVTTDAGPIRGECIDGIHRFLGVPYAAPPRTTGRFTESQRVPPWNGVRPATRPSPTAPQLARNMCGVDLEPLIGPGWRRGSDYLTTNIWTDDPHGTNKPVMVYVHGGAFMAGTGAAAAFDGASFARRGVVLITINYRLGAEGFLTPVDGPSNVGLRDQIAALEWVRTNAAAFGGDPDNVTVFGESAGATSIALLLKSPLAHGLFDRAIVQSGHDELTRSPHRAMHPTETFAEHLGVLPTVDGFRSVSEEKLLAVQAKLLTPQYRPDLREDSGFDPVYGRSLFLPVAGNDMVPSVDVAPDANSTSVALLIGTNLEEANLGAAEFEGLDEQSALSTVGQWHPAAEQFLSQYGFRSEGTTPTQAVVRALTDGLYRSPARRTATRHGGSTYFYEFCWRSPHFGAAHGLDLPFVFDTTSSCSTLIGVDPPSSLATFMNSVWVDFARTGNPGWPAYDGDRQMLAINETPRVVEDRTPTDIGEEFLSAPAKF